MITETYREIEIVLLEDENKWRFTANGRERSAPTLPKAREYIDNALDAVEKKATKKWEPFESLYHNSVECIKVRVTSRAEGNGYNGKPQFWITYKAKDYRGHEGGRREKVGIEKLFVLSPENEALIAEAKRLQTEAEKLEEQARTVLSGLQNIAVPID